MTIPCCLAIACIRSDGRAIGNLLDHLVPARLLLGAEVRPVEELLEAEHLDAAPCRPPR